jgi:hypothetical protein
LVFQKFNPAKGIFINFISANRITLYIRGIGLDKGEEATLEDASFWTAVVARMQSGCSAILGIF